jgi:hypothetical protein
VIMETDPTEPVEASHPLRVRAAGIAVAAVLAAAGLGACGGSSSPVSSNTQASSKTTASSGTTGSPDTTASPSTSTTTSTTTPPTTTSTTAPSTPSGGDEAAKSAAQIVKDARTATAGVSSVEVKGAVTQGGAHTSLDVVAGQDSGAGSLTYKGATFDAILRPPKLYLRASAASWKVASGSAAAGQLLAGKWLETAQNTSGFGSFSDLLRIGKLVSKLSSPQSLAKGAVTTYDGMRAIPITDTKKGSTLYVAATGKPYILAIVGRSASTGTITFTHYNSATIAAAPANSVSLKQLEQEG